MNKQTLRALKDSIEKWEGIANGTNLEYPHAKNCPLCTVFHKDRCKDCPVRNRTGIAYCINTPYHKAVQSHREHVGPRYHKTYLKNAQQELDFLKSLLPPP